MGTKQVVPLESLWVDACRAELHGAQAVRSAVLVDERSAGERSAAVKGTLSCARVKTV